MDRVRRGGGAARSGQPRAWRAGGVLRAHPLSRARHPRHGRSGHSIQQGGCRGRGDRRATRDPRGHRARTGGAHSREDEPPHPGVRRVGARRRRRYCRGFVSSTRFTELVGCEVPLQLAAMGSVGTTELAAAVVAAGGCGMVPMGVPPAAGPGGVNFLMPFEPTLEQVREAATNCNVVECFYADPRADVVDAIHSVEALAGWQVGSAVEASLAEESGCDYVVAQGTEAGGHVRGTEPLDRVLAESLAAVAIPVVAAGGVATAERFAELMRAGADGVRVGTRFLPCPESGAHPEYARRLLAASGDETVLTEWFGEGWEDAPHRVLRSALDAARKGGGRGVPPPAPEDDRDPSDMAMYAGTGVGHVTSAEPAATVVADLVRLL